MAFAKRSARSNSPGDRAFDLVNVLIMLVICFTMVYPMWYVSVVSFNDAADAMMGGIYWWPRKFSLESYGTVFKNKAIFTAFEVTIARTFLGTALNVFFTAMVAFGLSKKYLIGRRLWIGMGTVTLFFGGGLIPYFLVIKKLGLIDNFLVYILPAMFNFYNLIIFQSFFREIPGEIEESAKLDGANEFTIFTRFILPLSKPVLATIALFVGVWAWNDYFTGVIYINKPNLQPIQTFLYRVISETSSNAMLEHAAVGIRTTQVSSTSLKLATMVVTTTPVICIYPFLQKYFVKGLMLGSIKG